MHRCITGERDISTLSVKYESLSYMDTSRFVITFDDLHNRKEEDYKAGNEYAFSLYTLQGGKMQA